MFKVIQHYSKHCSYHFHSEYVLAGHFLKPYTGEAADGKHNMMYLTGKTSCYPNGSMHVDEERR
jgi:hypothetical protein